MTVQAICSSPIHLPLKVTVLLARQNAACVPELPSKELAVKRNQKHLTGLWKHLGDLVLLRRKVIYLLLRMKSPLDVICVVLFASESSVQSFLTCFRAKLSAPQLDQRTNLSWTLSGNVLFGDLLEMITLIHHREHRYHNYTGICVIYYLKIKLFQPKGILPMRCIQSVMATGIPIGFLHTLALLAAVCTLFYDRVAFLLPFQSEQDHDCPWTVLIIIILK